jgi:hypothetical protein
LNQAALCPKGFDDLQTYYTATHTQQSAEFAQDQANYKRAISACLEAHAYTVK